MPAKTELIETGLGDALRRARGADCPERLAEAMLAAVFPGGKRIRPRLVIAVDEACAGDDPGLALAGAVAVELLHCASLVHDDLPCFDNAATRRGRPSITAAYGERTAVLTGDALIVLAFDTLAATPMHRPQRCAGVLSAVARAVGAPAGIAAGQAWESEPSIDLDAYHRTKTGALFAGAAAVGALAAGAEAAPWHRFGEILGRAFQAADDVCDAVGDAAALGKPVGKDAALSRPSTVAERGVAGAVARVTSLIEEALDSVPACPGREAFRQLLLRDAKRLLPAGLPRVAA